MCCVWVLYPCPSTISDLVCVWYCVDWPPWVTVLVCVVTCLTVWVEPVGPTYLVTSPLSRTGPCIGGWGWGRCCCGTGAGVNACGGTSTLPPLKQKEDKIKASENIGYSKSPLPFRARQESICFCHSTYHYYFLWAGAGRGCDNAFEYHISCGIITHENTPAWGSPNLPSITPSVDFFIWPKIFFNVISVSHSSENTSVHRFPNEQCY